MTQDEITKLFERLARLVAATEQKNGDGMAWDYTFPDGQTHRYVIRGLKSHEDIEDSAFNLLIWIWNAKDYLKKRAQAVGKSANDIEQAVNDNHHFALCADLANTLKHGGLDRESRSGQKPQFGKVSFQAPQQSIGSITFRPSEVELQIGDPTHVDITLPILSDDGEQIGETFLCAHSALKELERLRDQMELTP